MLVMSRLPHQLEGTTPFPNLLLDGVMPKLSDTEWRLLCVVVRQTYGWRLPDGSRKPLDWLSHAQLRRKTGRSSAAISRAIDCLVRRKLLAVRDLNGQILVTAAERRRSRHRLGFSLNEPGNRTAVKRMRQFAFTNRKCENNKRNFDKRKQQHGLVRGDPNAKT